MATGRLPSESDFPSNCKVSIIPPTDGKTPVNVLVLLHGLGDSASNFAALGRNMNLPETVTVALQGPAALPFDLGGYHWGDDIVFDQASGQMDIDTGFAKSTPVVKDAIDDVLVAKCGFRHRQIYLFGLGQGGMVAMNVGRSGVDELGGIVTLGGPLPAASSATESAKARTPVLVAHGSSKSAISVTAAKSLKKAYSAVSFAQWKRPGDGMPTSREEMLPIMKFLAARMQSRAGVPPGAQELS